MAGLNKAARHSHRAHHRQQATGRCSTGRSPAVGRGCYPIPDISLAWASRMGSRRSGSWALRPARGVLRLRPELTAEDSPQPDACAHDRVRANAGQGLLQLTDTLDQPLLLRVEDADLDLGLVRETGSAGLASRYVDRTRQTVDPESRRHQQSRCFHGGVEVHWVQVGHVEAA